MRRYNMQHPFQGAHDTAAGPHATNQYIGGHKKTPKHTHHWRSEKKVKKHKIVHLLLLYQQHHQQQELQLLLFLVSGRIRHDAVSDVVGATTFRRAQESPQRDRRRLPAARPRDKQVRSKTAPSSTVLVTYQREQMNSKEATNWKGKTTVSPVHAKNVRTH